MTRRPNPIARLPCAIFTISPGRPVSFGAWPFITDLRSGSFTGSSGEQALIGAAAVQMGNFYGLPTSVGAG
ncbi:trimethylamine methyltransferase family protein [Ruegeria arenilitoris]|nr:trimethylamine methyltransferase family protein [Ruegeria arenilitoris]